MRIHFPIILAAFFATAATAQTTSFDWQNQSITQDLQVLDVHVGGRVKIEPLPAPMPTGAKAYVHQWPGVYFEAAFDGEKVLLKFDDTANEYRLLIDDLAPIILGQPGRAEITISALKPGQHHLRLEKVTESIGKAGAFDGFYIPSGETPLPVNVRARQIEFIGDSGMTGYGMRSAVRQCTQETVRLTSDTQDAYPALTAKHFDADYQINAISGRGLVRNYDGFVPDIAMSLVYPYVLADQKTTIYDDPAWRPQIIIIGLLADFMKNRNPGERWKNLKELAADYMKAYRGLILDLHRRSPRASLLIWWPDASKQPDPDVARMLNEGQRSILAAAHEAGHMNVHFIMPEKDLGLDKSACDGHGSIADNQKEAAWLIGYIDAHSELWRGK
jgi:Carbohydrate esterase 2 N-terminal